MNSAADSWAAAQATGRVLAGALDAGDRGLRVVARVED